MSEEFKLKKGLHPEYVKCEVTCACGNSFVTRSTVPRLRLDICSACHPFYTGKQKLVDTAGRVEQFVRKYEKSRKLQEKAVQRASEKKAAKAGSATAVKANKEAGSGGESAKD